MASGAYHLVLRDLVLAEHAPGVPPFDADFRVLFNSYYQQWLTVPRGHAVGHAGEGFAFDNERPRHEVFLQGCEMAQRPVSNAEFLRFVKDGGYAQPQWWLAEGWDRAARSSWSTRGTGGARPAAWMDGMWQEFSLHGALALDGRRPVCHLSYFEADAYARWAGARLPTEAEWEAALAAQMAQRPQHGEPPGPVHPCAMQPGSHALGETLPAATTPWVAKATFTIEADGRLSLADQGGGHGGEPMAPQADMQDQSMSTECKPYGAVANQRTTWFPYTGVFVRGGTLVGARADGGDVAAKALTEHEGAQMLYTGKDADATEYYYAPCVGAQRVSTGGPWTPTSPTAGSCACAPMRAAERGQTPELKTPALAPFVLVRYQSGAMIPVPMRAVLATVDLAERRVVMQYQGTYAVEPAIRKMELRLIVPAAARPQARPPRATPNAPRPSCATWPAAPRPRAMPSSPAPNPQRTRSADLLPRSKCGARQAALTGQCLPQGRAAARPARPCAGIRPWPAPAPGRPAGR
ncbi:Formylglycine-generating enzyme [Manis javanica]|nr:Formylglycine-generating enzyme [Manis javanica]